MYLLKSINIEDFLNKYKKNIKFYKDINFLIGENGTGKTTILKIVLGVITLNVRLLHILPYRSVELEFSDYKRKNSKNILIKVSKKEKDISISLKKEDDNINFQIPIYVREFFDREQFHNDRFSMIPTRYLTESKQIDKFKKIIQDNISFDDLSVERLPFNILHDSRYSRERDISINGIVRTIVEKLTNYFKVLSLIAAKADDILKETYVMSLLTPPNKKQAHKVLSADEMEQKLDNILKTFSVDKSKHQKILREFIIKYPENSVKEENKQDYLRMLQIIDKYDEVAEEKRKIFAPKQRFLDVLNKLLKNKEIKYEELKGNKDIYREDEDSLFISQDGRKLKLEHLSSGEKHLLILLGETLLQKNSPKIFIADEPEISLHIEWQEQIVSAIRQLNENAQIIFATHSPEIVSSHSNKIHNLSEINK